MSMKDKYTLLGYCLGIITVLAVLGMLLLASTSVNDVSEVKYSPRYTVIVDDAQFLCMNKPQINSSFITLKNCNGTQSRRVVIRSYGSITVTPSERVE